MGAVEITCEANNVFTAHVLKFGAQGSVKFGPPAYAGSFILDALLPEEQD